MVSIFPRHTESSVLVTTSKLGRLVVSSCRLLTGWDNQEDLIEVPPAIYRLTVRETVVVSGWPCLLVAISFWFHCIEALGCDRTSHDWPRRGKFLAVKAWSPGSFGTLDVPSWKNREDDGSLGWESNWNINRTGVWQLKFSCVCVINHNLNPARQLVEQVRRQDQSLGNEWPKWKTILQNMLSKDAHCCNLYFIPSKILGLPILFSWHRLGKRLAFSCVAQTGMAAER